MDSNINDNTNDNITLNIINGNMKLNNIINFLSDSKLSMEEYLTIAQLCSRKMKGRLGKCSECQNLTIDCMVVNLDANTCSEVCPDCIKYCKVCDVYYLYSYEPSKLLHQGHECEGHECEGHE